MPQAAHQKNHNLNLIPQSFIGSLRLIREPKLEKYLDQRSGVTGDEMPHVTKFQEFYKKHELKSDIGIFIGGYLFDILTFSTPDDWFSISQQFVYLTIIGSLIFLEVLHESRKFAPSQKFAKVWNFRKFFLHFFLGSLLSVYSLFYIKSSSFWASSLFLLVIIGILVGNETKYIQDRNTGFKFSLFILCVFSFFSVLAPTVLGFIGWTPFVLSLVLTALIIFWGQKLYLRNGVTMAYTQGQLIRPGGVVLSVICGLYILGVIPPVPLSLNYAGVFHNVEKLNGSYSLTTEKPWWKFWHEGDQFFKAQSGDSVFVFVEVFAPSRFKDTLYMRWEFDSKESGWTSSDRVPIEVVGGRLEGFRGFTKKRNFQAGSWRVKVETSDRREIGRINFDIETVSSSETQREFRTLIR